ncbi:MAG: hypothetical protein J0H06_13975, partial [Actinobacteria bacterium]|nr:hypothetical protein [Actinomycetota bacterium]
MTAHGQATVDGRPATPDPARLALVEAGLAATAAAVVFSAALITLQVGGARRADALAGCALLALACAAAARIARTRPAGATVTAGLLVAAAGVVSGADDHLVFLPAVMLLIALTPVAYPAPLTVAVVVATAGFLAPPWASSAPTLRLA